MRSGNPSHSDCSSSVTLTVSGARPQPVLTVSPLGQIFEGDSVTLRCEVKGASAGWRYYWYRTGQSRAGLDYVSYNDRWVYLQPLSDSSSGAGGNFTISAVTGTHRGPYWCRAERGDAHYYTQYSGAVTLTVSVRPWAVLTLEPDWTPVFTGETVTLHCQVQGSGDTDWRYRWYRGETQVHQTDSSTRDEVRYTISSVSYYHSGDYTCEGVRSGNPSHSDRSSPVSLTVSESVPQPVLTVSPPGQIFKGDSVTLHCEMKRDSPAGWRYYWYRESQSGSPVYKTDSSTGALRSSYTINPVSLSHFGQYWCRAGRGDAPYYTQYSGAVTLTVSVSDPLVLCVSESVPQPVLTVSPPGQIFKGDSVTLHCEMKRDSPAGWRYYWYRESQSGSPVYKTDSSTGALRSSYTINPVSLSHFGQYWCRAGRGDAPYYTQYSGAVTLTVSERPQAVLTLQPDWTPVFTGETVTLRCQVQGSGDTDWRYRWYRWYRGETQVYLTYLYTGDEGRYTISSDSYYHSGDYTCEGVRSGNPSHSDRSSPVTLTVSGARPQPVLTVSPLGQIFEGDSVTLRCEVKGASAGWRYYWYRTGQSRAGLDYVSYNDRWVYLQPLSDSSSGAGGNFTISAVTGTHRGPYWCRAERGDAHYYTQYSGAVTLTVSELLPRVNLTVDPPRVQQFIGSVVTLKCGGPGGSAGWTVKRYTKGQVEPSCSSHRGETTADGCFIRYTSESDSGVYWCQSGAERSSAVTLRVTGGHVILESPPQPVTEGDTLTLRCGLRGYRSDSAVFYKDGVELQPQTVRETTIASVSVTDQGSYSCKYSDWGESPESWVSVRGETPLCWTGLTDIQAPSLITNCNLICETKCC
ncbi:FCRL5 protein, partial [Amia calva]|nr:FCRL5 protein [Amia calva]